MTLKIDRDTLLAAVQRVVGVVASRNTIAVLDNLLLEVSDTAVTITATDLDLQVSCTVSAFEAAPWRITVHAQKFAAAVASFKPGDLTIVAVGGKSALTVKMGRGVRTLATLPAEDFPARKALEQATQFSMPGAALARLLDSTIGSASTEEARPYLQGTFIHIVDNRLRAAGSDGHRLVRAEAPVPEGAAGMPDTIVPTKTVNMMRKLLVKHDLPVDLAVTDRAIAVRIGHTSVIAKVIDGTFPDYSRIIPTGDAKHAISLVRDALVEPVASVAAVVDAEGAHRTRAVKFELGAGDDHQVTAQDPVTSASEPLDATVEGGAMIFAVNYQYLVATAKLFAESGTLRLALADPAAAMKITSDKDPDLIAVVMPMRA
jgi:DNA polymerase-3 subunit beta